MSSKKPGWVSQKHHVRSFLVFVSFSISRIFLSANFLLLIILINKLKEAHPAPQKIKSYLEGSDKLKLMIKDRNDERIATQQKIDQGTEAGIKIIDLLAHIPLFYFLPLAFYPVLFYPNTFYERVTYQSFLLHAGQDACDAFYVPSELHEHTCYCCG